LAEHSIYDYIEKQPWSEDILFKIREASLVIEKYNKKNILDKHNKLYSIVESLQTNIDENKKVLYENIHSLLFSKNTINGLDNKLNSIKVISECIKKNGGETQTDNTKTDKIVENFNEKYGDILTEEQKNVLKQMFHANDSNKKDFYSNLKSECLNITNTYLKEDVDLTTKEKLLNVKEQLLNEEYSQSSFILDITRMIDLKNTLS
jgi:uncharacterized protein YpuA (DUF1002 family)